MKRLGERAMIDTVILDWSGVISDDWKATFATSNDVLEEYGHERINMEKFKELYEMPWKRFYKKLGMQVNSLEEYNKWERLFPKHYHYVKAFPFAKKALEWLKEHKKNVLVLSSHNQSLLEKEIIDYGFKDLIDYVDASNEDKREKIDSLLETRKAERKNTLYVGDMVHDVETANGAGVKSVAVLSGYDLKEKLERAKPDFILNDLGELPGLIEKLESDSK